MKMIALMAVMAIVTYIIRALPITLFRKEIKSKWLKSFLYYIPYAVLGAMTFPAIFFSTGSVSPPRSVWSVLCLWPFSTRGLWLPLLRLL